MTEEQSKKFEDYITSHLGFRPAIMDDGICRWINDEEIIRFTKINQSYQYNAEYEINDNPIWLIWFSQLSECFFEADFHVDKNQHIALEYTGGGTIPLAFPMGLYSPIVVFKDGSIKIIRNTYDPRSFFNSVKDKTFRVDIPTDYKYSFNRKGKTWKEKNFRSIYDAQQFVERCINNDRIEDIGDLVKESRAYALTEI